MREKYESLSLAVLKDLAKARGLKGTSALRKAQLIEVMLEQDEKDKAAALKEASESAPADNSNQDSEKSSQRQSRKTETGRSRDNSGRTRKTDARLNNMKSYDGEESVPMSGEGSSQSPAQPQDESESQAAVPVQNTAHPQDGNRPSQTTAQPTSRAGASRNPEDAHTRRPVPARNTERPRMTRAGLGKPAAGGAYNREDSRDRTQSQRRRAPENGTRSGYDRSNQDRGYGNVGSGAEERGYRLSQSNGADRDDRTTQGNGADRDDRTSQGNGADRDYRSPQGSGEERGSHFSQNAGEERGSHLSQSAGEEYGSRFSTDGGENHGFVSTNQDTAAGPRQSAAQPGRAAEASMTEGSRMADADRPPAELSQLDSGQSVSGILEVMPDGYGFIRSDNYLPGENDVYVSPSQIRRFNLKTGDIISGNTRIKSQQEKFSALLYLKKINDLAPSEAAKRCNFEDMTPIFPNERLRMEREQRGIAMRIVDLFSPIGKGQRGMIVSPPKAGKTTLLKDIARSVLKNNPEMRLLILLIDERPEEVTDIKEAIRGDNVEVVYSTFDETPEHHKRVSEMVIERAKRLVEQKQDVIILLDSITRLARAYNLTVPPSGRTLSGGLDPAALHMPKRFFGAARNMREGGSLTILATALVDTGSKMDDVVYEEFKGTGNMELVLDRKLSERRVFPAIDIPKSGTRREDLLLDREEQEAIYYMRRALNGMKSDDAVESILNMLLHTRDNRDLVTRVRRQKGV